MNPTIEDGAKGYMLKVKENTKIERFDVVASKYSELTNNYIIKREFANDNSDGETS